MVGRCQPANGTKGRSQISNRPRHNVLVLPVLLVTLISNTTVVFAQGEHSRRAAAELQVIIGDLRKLTEITSSTPTSKQAAGLEKRILGGLSSLDLLLRLANQETGKTQVSYRNTVSQARSLLNRRQLAQLDTLLTPLSNRFKLSIPRITANKGAINNARQLHIELCAACHDHGPANVERPAYNLFQQAATEPDTEFFARMIVGVRGDRITGIDNPLSDIQLISLITLYKQGQ